MDKLKTMEYYILQTQNILKENFDNKKLTDRLSTLYIKGNYSRIKIIASGSSGNAAFCAKYIMEKYLNVPVDIIAPYTFANYPQISEDDFILVVSQSGYSVNALDALKTLKQKNRCTIALTGDLDSDIKDYSEILIEYGVGEELEGYVTKGVTSLVFFLIKLTLEINKKLGKEDAFKELQIYCEQYKEMQLENFIREEKFLEKFKKNLLSMENCYIVGCGNAEGIAKEAALKIGETVKIVSCSYELEEYIHGPNLQLTPNYNVFIIDSSDDTSKHSHDIYLASRAMSDRVYYITDKDYDDENVLTLLNPYADFIALGYLQFFQLLSYRISKDLKSIPKHPLMLEFDKIVNPKTINYNED